MLVINNHITDPYFNIASEEYLFSKFRENIFMLYQNTSSIIVGKHQNAFSEINNEFVRKNKIAVVRRLSGGGAVYHDLGNLNFTFIINGKEGELLDFRKHTQPIADILGQIGISAEFDKRNNLFIKGKKISGNAEHIFKKRILHHGTLLYDSDLGKLDQALRGNVEKYVDKAVKSIRSEVANISTFLTNPMQTDDFKNLILKGVKNLGKNSHYYQFTNNDILEINKLVNTKYMLWDWNYGYSPKFKAMEIIQHHGKLIKLEFEVEKGKIKAIRNLNNKYSEEIEIILQKLLGEKYMITEMKNTASSINRLE